MARLSYRQYQGRAQVAMALYIACMLLVWPAVRVVSALPLKVLLALVPLAPMFYVLALMARRVRDSDELEQRTHLVALGVATGLTAALSLVGGFLCAAGVLSLDGSVLIWVFPFLMICYGLGRWRVARAYGLESECQEGGRFAWLMRVLLLGVFAAIVALYGWRHGWDDFKVGLFAGIAGGLLLGGLLKALFARRSTVEP